MASKSIVRTMNWNCIQNQLIDYLKHKWTQYCNFMNSCGMHNNTIRYTIVYSLCELKHRQNDTSHMRDVIRALHSMEIFDSDQSWVYQRFELSFLCQTTFCVKSMVLKRMTSKQLRKADGSYQFVICFHFWADLENIKIWKIQNIKVIPIKMHWNLKV